MFKVNNKDQNDANGCRSGVFIVNFEHISHLAPGWESPSFLKDAQVNFIWSYLFLNRGEYRTPANIYDAELFNNN